MERSPSKSPTAKCPAIGTGGHRPYRPDDRAAVVELSVRLEGVADLAQLRVSKNETLPLLPRNASSRPSRESASSKT